VTGRGVTLRRLRVANSADRDALARQPAPRPAGLGPTATLLVRRVRCTGGRDDEPARRASGAPTLAGALDAALAGAARPAVGPVGAAATAVLFADRAELLAALALDLADGSWAGRWWWPVLFGTQGPDAAVWPAWERHVEAVPAALDLLDRAGRAVDVARLIPPDRARALELAVRATTGLPAPDPKRAPAGGTATAPAEPTEDPPAWWRHAPEACAPGLVTAQRRLLALGLALRRAPAEVRLPRPVVRTILPPGPPLPGSEARQHGRTRIPVVPAPGRTAGPLIPGRRTRRPARRSAPPLVEPPGDPSLRAGPETRAALPRSPMERADRPAGAALRGRTGSSTVAARRARRGSPVRPPPASSSAGSLLPDARATTTDLPPARSAVASAAAAAATDGPPRHPAPESADPPALGTTPAWPVRLYTETTTGLGGLFFLVGVSQHLGLYPDFTAPRDPGIGLDLWNLVHLLGRALLAPAPEPADPVWPLLAALAGRPPGTSANAGFEPPPWRTPPAWLSPFPPGATWAWSTARGTLRVEHAAGFPVLLTARTAQPHRRQLADELRRARLAPPGLRRAALPLLPRRPAAAWIAALARYVRLRCALALGCAAAEVTDMLLRRPAQVRTTPATLEVVFSLAGHPLPIRLAGLDRDPGWVPAAGRSISFVFEADAA
jgi:hypothetical protein